MLINFEDLPTTSKIWIYQSNRPFTAEETSEINLKLEKFLNTWTAHGDNLTAGFKMPYNRFIIIGLNQSLNNATGCSIDASVKFIQELETTYNIDLLDKMNVTFKQGDNIVYKPLKDFIAMAKQRAVTKNTIVFNNLVTNIAEFNDYWEVPATDSWHKRYF